MWSTFTNEELEIYRDYKNLPKMKHEKLVVGSRSSASSIPKHEGKGWGLEQGKKANGQRSLPDSPLGRAGWGEGRKEMEGIL